MEYVIPHSQEAEQAVLSSMLKSKDAVSKVIGKLKKEHFYFIEHSLIFEAMVELAKSSQSKEIDIVTLADQLKKMKTIELVGGKSYLADLLDVFLSSANVLYHANIVLEKATLRDVVSLGEKLKDSALDPSCEVDTVLELAQKGVLDLSTQKIRQRIRTINEVLSSVFDQVQEAKHSSISGITTGYRSLDKVLTGFKKSDLIIIAARPSVGKTTLALNFAYNAAKNGHPVLFFSIETPSEQLGIRLLSISSKIDSRNIQSFDLKDSEMSSMMKGMGNLSQLPIHFEDTGALSTLELRSITRQVQMKTDVHLIVIDYLTLMQSSTKRPEGRYQEVSQIVREIKSFAKESGIPIILLSQLTRENEKRAEKRPNLSDLRDSGEIEQTADVVLFLHRDDYYEPHTSDDRGGPEMASLTEVIVAKHRNGPTGVAKLMYRKNISSFYEAEDTGFK